MVITTNIQRFSRAHYIDGHYAASVSKETTTLYNPKNGSTVIEDVAVAGAKAVIAAETAFNGPWSCFSGAQRAECLRKLADLLEDHLEDILTLDSLTTGNPVSLIPTREKNYIKTCLLYYAGWTE
jgi:acyl-CoA reductase-like NAD-dependent aldehyde dehydrogenase